MRRALLATGLLAVLAPAPAGAATVELMVVGKQRVLREPAPVKLASRSLRVTGRRCAVGRATPLSVLAGTRLRVRLQDYGSCGRSPRDAGALYVTRIGPDRRRGPAGWVYKVGRRVGTTGAGDPSGPFGTGRRLRGGERLLWFWCVQARGEACQRTLEVSPASSTVAPGAPLRVTVRGYDDSGRGVPVAGATVRLGSATATTDAAGVAQVAAPASGAARLTAERAGMVRSWPRTVRVG